MRHSIIIIQLLFAIVTGAFCMNADASLVWGWGIDNPVQVVLPTDSVVFMATLRNDADSTENLYGTNIRDRGYWVSSASCCSVELNSQYTLNNPGMGGDVQQTQTFFSQFNNMTLAPGESFNFIFLYLTPKIGTANIGTYDFSARLGLRYLATGVGPITQYSHTDPSIVVNPIPVPPAAMLMLSGLLSLLAYRRSENARIGDVS